MQSLILSDELNMSHYIRGHFQHVNCLGVHHSLRHHCTALVHTLPERELKEPYQIKSAKNVIRKNPPKKH